jgi:UDP-N-acetylmuramoylalanine--D-glutamate ligase
MDCHDIFVSCGPYFDPAVTYMKLPEHVLIIGFGKSGRAVASFCEHHKIRFSVVDDAPEAATEILQKYNGSQAVSSEEFAARFSEICSSNSVVVVSPGISPEHASVCCCEKHNLDCINEIEFALRYALHIIPKMIAVTGTNGKTTVVELLTHILSASGHTALAVGNIGLPFLEAVRQPVWPEWFIVELSSFQLERISQKVFAFGCWLNISQNHLDWHKTFQNYQSAKERLCSLIQKDGSMLVHESIQLQSSKDTQIVRFGKNETSDLFWKEDKIFSGGCQSGVIPETIVWDHDKENFLAVWSLAQLVGISEESIRQHASTFRKSPHRIAFIANVNGVTYWDDSKGTTVAATEAAVAAVPGPVVLIAGGDPKGACFAPWKTTLPGKVALLVAIGQAKESIGAAVEQALPVQYAQTLKEAVHIASTACKPPYSVLLSPGCASFDMFRDYKDRGLQFQEIVRSL